MEVPEALVVAVVAQEACPAAMEEDHQANKQANEETSKAKPWDYSTEHLVMTVKVMMMMIEEEMAEVMVAKKVFAAVE